jgi:hypothetical protein
MQFYEELVAITPERNAGKLSIQVSTSFVAHNSADFRIKILLSVADVLMLE